MQEDADRKGVSGCDEIRGKITVKEAGERSILCRTPFPCKSDDCLAVRGRGLIEDRQTAKRRPEDAGEGCFRKIEDMLEIGRASCRERV